MPSRRAAAARHEHPHGVLEAQVRAIEAAAADHALVQDAAAGLVPPYARRGLRPTELASKVSFAAIATGQQLATQQVTRRLVDDRQAFLDLLLADLATMPSNTATVERLLELEVAGLTGVAGVVELLNTSGAAHQQALQIHADTAAAMARSEALAQGIQLAEQALDQNTLVQIRQLAQRLAVAPHVDLVRFLRDAAVRAPVTVSPQALVQALQDHATGLSGRPLEKLAADTVASADGMGRQSVAVADAPAQIYASELLDGNTCGPCSFIDGTQYDTIAAARLDYPGGKYIRCEGLEACRGTLVYVWATETPPTI